MKKGRPSRAPKKLKDGYYMSITLKNTTKPVRIMRETIAEMEAIVDTHIFTLLQTQTLKTIDMTIWIQN